MEYKDGLATYVGDVVADQGTRHLTGDKLIIHQNKAGKIDKMTSYGNPAHIRLLPSVGGEEVTGHALIVIFRPLVNTLTLIDKAHLKQGENSFNGQKITYNTQTKVVISPQTKAGRSELILEPANDNQTQTIKVQNDAPTDRP